MKCPQCKTNMEKVKFDVGYDVVVDSLNCKNCGFNITDNNKLKKAMNKLKHQMSKEVKVVGVGTGIGLRFPNDIVKNYKLKKGEGILLKPESDGIKIMLE